jgi:hypothetical protein
MCSPLDPNQAIPRSNESVFTYTKCKSLTRDQDGRTGRECMVFHSSHTETAIDLSEETSLPKGKVR